MNVLLLPDTAMAESLAGRLVEWSAQRLLDPFCIWTAKDQESIVVDRLSLGEREVMPLGDALAAVDPERVELVAFLPLVGDEAAALRFTKAVEHFIVAAGRVFDFNPDRPLACVMAVAPQTSEQEVPETLFRAEWANLLVAPEDRANPGAFNLLDGRDNRFLRHAAHAAATIASIWATPEQRRPDLPAKLRDEPAGPQRVRVRVVRCFSRVVELGHIADHVAQTVFDSSGGWPRPGPSFERPSDPDSLIAAVIRAYLGSHRSILGRRPFKPITEDPPEELGMREALMKLARQALAYLQRLPSELLEEAIENVYRKAAVYIEQISGPKFRVKPWREVDGEHGFVELSETLSKVPLVIEDGEVASAWFDLRQVVLGLVDGSELPESVRPAVRAPQDRRKIVGDPTRLAFDPAHEGDPPALPYVPMLEPIRAEVRTALDEAGERAAALEQAELTARSEREAEPPPEPESAAKRFMRLLRGGSELLKAVRRILGTSLLGLLALSAAWALLPLPWAVAVTLVLVVGGYVLGGRLARHVLRLPRIPENERATRELRELNLALERAQARGDVERLGRRLEELDAWIEILAALLHRPWVRDRFGEFEGVVGTIDEEDFPVACSIVVTSSDGRLLERIGGRIKAKAFEIGWLSSIYRSVEQRTMHDYHLDHGGDGPLPTPLDPQRDEDSPLRALREAIRRGDGRSRRDNPIAAELLHAIDAATLDEFAPEVRPISPEKRPLGPTATWIAPPVGYAGVAESRAERLLGLRGWSATATIVSPGVALTAASAVTERLATAISSGGSLVDVDAVRFPAGTDLAVLQLGEDRGEGAAVAVAEGLEGLEGEGVVALEASADGPRARWGYVIGASAGLTAMFDGGDPGPGAPVFDLGASLIAVCGPRGRLLPVPAIDGLLEMDDEEDQPSPSRSPGGSGFPMAASAFLEKIAAKNGYRELSPGYWAEHTDANAIDFSHPSLQRIEESETVAQLTGGARFMRPLRVMMHRVEVTLPVEPGELFACRSVEAEASTGP